MSLFGKQTWVDQGLKAPEASTDESQSDPWRKEGEPR
jgi:hypothetical protein